MIFDAAYDAIDSASFPIKHAFFAKGGADRFKVEAQMKSVGRSGEFGGRSSG